MNVSENKKELREFCKKKRHCLNPADCERLSEKIAAIITGLPEYKACSTLLLYSAINGEADLQSIIAEAVKEGKTVGLPLCDTESETMRFIETDGSNLAVGAYGIAEPGEGRVISENADSLCLVPGLAFDEKLNRLGRGKGYYDKFLSDFDGVKIGISFDDFIFEEVPAEDNDVKMDAVVTEKRVIRN